MTVSATATNTAEATDLLEEAHQRAMRSSPAEMAAHLQDLFGQKLTALMTGVDHPKTVGKWVAGQVPHPANLRRLRDAFQIAILIELADSRQTAQAWFQGMNPRLEDQPPALILADDPDGGA